MSHVYVSFNLQAIKVSLADIKPTNNRSKWNQDPIDFLNTYIVNKTRLRLFVVDNINEISVVLYECYASIDVCVNAVLVAEQFAESSGKL